jgi:hypothetical protein
LVGARLPILDSRRRNGKNILDMIDYIENTYNTDVWHRARARMSEIDARVKQDRIASELDKALRGVLV